MMTLRQKLTRYSGSLLLVLAVHAVAIIVALRWSAPQVIELPPAAMLVELAPMPAPPTPPPPNVVQPPQPPAPVEEMPLPKLAEAEKPEIAIPKAVKPKAKPQPPKVQKKPEPPQEKPADPKPVDTPPVASQPVKSDAPTQQPNPPSDSNAKRSWQSDLQNHLGKYQKYPEDARRRNIAGSTRLNFEVDAEGKVISVSIAQSSGNASLDRATLEMIRRAQPLPKPPAEILRNGSIEVNAPFNYSLKDAKSRF
ncbi:MULTISPECIES: energy transducer TonB [unclassified Pseudomonas]|uniref:energy transducer TonB n=1 Tax=unclassified Pseudomonas TaxID=196821 RepID=UPI002AC8E8B8|nr:MULTISPECIES: energy transducer TonB [unclassified Pseudomonas]MEB0041739.1 energy transducer TonB [Pseudomonas sp. MH10]MEB0077880.1 energy transducer TonB [Pseudomonas sp. MH10out]MEB0102822.1 energy transducer TonB [Pseudomonas sp. CCI3.2]MEB0131700.1 energy transducer TonB [Pseudomonas sp. CCI2.4]MEB0159517.1 energy transducer TonB [Pseudomonas sp. AH2 (2023)]